MDQNDANSIITFIGILFAIAAIFYFTWEFLFDFGDGVRLLVLICLTVLFFFLAEILWRRDS